ncbi:MAG: TIGR00266 family protein [Actinomycetes bacterium]
MRVDLRHQPSFSVARVQLDPGEQVRTESGAMAMHSLGISLEAQMRGGVMGALKRGVLGGESLFVTTYTAHPQAAGWVDVAANLPGDIWVTSVDADHPLFITRGSWLASAAGVELDTKWGGSQQLFGGEGGFVLHATGQGPVIVAAYGAMDVHELQQGQGFTVDSGHLVAYDPSVTLTTRKAATGIMATMKSGEGLVMDFMGPGRVVTQSRSPNSLVSWLQSVLPGNRG